MKATQQDVARVAQYAAMAAHAESAWHIQNALEAAWSLESDAYDPDVTECAIALLIEQTAPTRERAFECVIIQNGERSPDAFYGVNYQEARERADRVINDMRGQGVLEVSQIIFDCEL
jgi:hypothetical protein